MRRWLVVVALACACACGGGSAEPGPLDLVPALSRLHFDRSLFLTHAPDGSDRIFVVEQGGRIHVFANDPAAASTRVFPDLSGRVSRAGNEEGLLGFAFHPDYAANGPCYVYYSVASPRRSRISRFTVSADPDDNAQSLDTLPGRILRLTPDGGVPSDNPFADRAGARGEIRALACAIRGVSRSTRPSIVSRRQGAPGAEAADEGRRTVQARCAIRQAERPPVSWRWTAVRPASRSQSRISRSV